MKNIKWALCQMKVVPGNPKVNADYAIAEIKKADERKRQILVLPEAAIPGYLVGDAWEDEAFVREIMLQNERIREATSALDITVIFGSALPDFTKRNEDGRFRLMNCAFVANNGKWLGITSKTLQPNYRYFDDGRHFFSKRQSVSEANEKIAGTGSENWRMQLLICSDWLKPIEIPIGKKIIKAGVILCEDMWHSDYPVNAARELVKHGAEIIVNLSASPWGWQKNRKRHQVVSDLLVNHCRVPLIYINNSGMQNNGKNIIIFDGASTVYDRNGRIVFEIGAYQSGVVDFSFTQKRKIKEVSIPNDTAELLSALECAGKEFFATLPENMRKAHIGVSGGIDSALSAAFHVHLIGKENVYLYYMPMDDYSSPESLALAQQLADNLGIVLEIIPISKIVNEIAGATGVVPGTLAYKNIQARVRMEILAPKAQQIGGVFPCNSNKVEIAFGYGTMYADIAGYMALFGDLVKREIYQVADYMNREIFKREVIPAGIFTRRPTAELDINQFDPFDYGNLFRRGYHDEMVRAFTEFRKNPEWFMDCYYKGTLERELKLDEGTLARLFPKAEDFVADLKRCWNLFCDAVRKRVQAPPIPVVSKRAFGFDYREFLGMIPMTTRFYELEEMMNERNNKKEKIYIFGSSLNPPCVHHQQIVEFLRDKFGMVVVYPCWLRPDKPSVSDVDPVHRMEMAKIAFSQMPGVVLDFTDFEERAYAPTYLIDQRYKEMHPDAEIWHVIGTEFMETNEDGVADLDTWDNAEEIRKNLNFVILDRAGYECDGVKFPDHSVFFDIPGIFGSATYVREMIRQGYPTFDYLDEEIRRYIDKYRLYR